MATQAIVTITKDALKTDEVGAKYPHEFSAVRAVCADDVDLGKKNGWSLGDRWLKKGESALLDVGCHIVYKINVGSHRSPEYRYFAVEVLGDNETRLVADAEIKAAVDAVSDKAVKAKALNSEAYAIAVYIKAQERDDEAEAMDEAVRLARRLAEIAGDKAPEILAEVMAQM